MTEIFTSLRDLHTNYILPSPFRADGSVPAIPRVVMLREWRHPAYIMAEAMGGFSHPTFLPGVNLTYWNGIPIDRAIEIAAFSYHAGSNPAAQAHPGGRRPYQTGHELIARPPDEEWVLVGYEDLNGQSARGVSCRLDNYRASAGGRCWRAGSPQTDVAAAFGLDLEGDAFRRINKMLFAQHVIAEKQRIQGVRQERPERHFDGRRLGIGSHRDRSNRGRSPETEAEAASTAVQGTASTMPDIFWLASKRVADRSSTFSSGYVRISTFMGPTTTTTYHSSTSSYG